MIFPKEYLEEMVKERALSVSWKNFPFAPWVKREKGEKTALDLITYNLQTFFDLNSEELKKKMYNSRVELLNNCYKSEWVDDFFVNKKKIDQCIHNTEVKHIGKYRETKNLYVYNSKLKII